MPAKMSAPGRKTATFEPYYWEAYNEIARPDRYDWYLITRWLPALGPEGFVIVKALRNLCYFNPKDGALRDTCQITVDELAEMTGMKRSTLYRVLEGNEALSCFVQKQPDVLHVEGRTRRLPPRWRVCMDTPIHPLDMEEYDLLRAGRESNREENETARRKSQIEIYEKRKSQIGTYGGRKSQNDERKSQNPERKSQIGITSKEDSLPSGSIPTDIFTPSAGAAAPEFPPQSDPQGGRGDKPAALSGHPLARAWAQTLAELSTTVNKPTFEAHLKALWPGAWDETAGVVEIVCPSAFTRQWIAKRHGGLIEELLAAALGRESVTARLTAPGK